ncbi:glycoside hydrolase family 2 TIM barrel-domain containing protein [Curtobacterium sp. MCJR17_043]|uniref:glycoside hydrolase family 2 TIM barrel-domain containing protein n=1 Tax=Curtobacterium sp. MCJR17_043 TaxID=2175660 RepID=UPI0024DF8D35|nr:glycoside hydrolase family 2 TIM barrel-domain containing protein [Curtobacterium sp. MCJR17_043]WIB37094.1 glycoside hydrolase family 2 TIM barrel-domain containing protein [Curtobacterium sp. MCJR17_043]
MRRTRCAACSTRRSGRSRTWPHRTRSPTARRSNSSRPWGSTPHGCTRRSRTRGSCTGRTASASWCGARHRPRTSSPPTAVRRLTAEWTAAVERDASHPSIVTWVPFNESWGIQHVVSDPAQQAYSRALVDLTRALDPSRPVIGNDGWEQQDTDIVTIHDYEGDGAVLARTYADDAARTRALEGLAPSGHPQFVGGAVDQGQPVMLTEFGGVRHQSGGRREEGWGYTTATDGDDWVERITALHDAVRASTFLAGSCWTQLTDTMQEANGLLNADRSPKVPVEQIRRAVTGQ